jgi:ribokinase
MGAEQTGEGDAAMKAAEIIVVGSYNRDIVLSVDRFPRPGETCLGRGRLESPGGKGSNQALQAAQCGVTTGLIGAIGADSAGDEALDLWRARGVDTRSVVRLTDAGTGMAMILVNRKAENMIVVDSGANARLSAGHVHAAATTISRSRMVVAQLETPVVATEAAFGLARQAGARTLLNAAPAPESLSGALLALTDLLCVNHGEGAALSGHTEPQSIGTALLEAGVGTVLLTLGADGAMAFQSGCVPLFAPAPRVEAVDTTGAGDAFIGAFAAGWVTRADILTALQFAVAAGALACTRMGAAVSFGDAAEILALMP